MREYNIELQQRTSRLNNDNVNNKGNKKDNRNDNNKSVNQVLKQFRIAS